MSGISDWGGMGCNSDYGLESVQCMDTGARHLGQMIT